MLFGMDWRDSGRSCIRHSCGCICRVSPLQGELRFFKCRFLFSTNGMAIALGAWPAASKHGMHLFFFSKNEFCCNFVDILDIDNCSHPVPTVVQAIIHPTFMQRKASTIVLIMHSFFCWPILLPIAKKRESFKFAFNLK